MLKKHFNKLIYKPKRAREHHSPIIQRLLDEIDNEPWHLKMKRNFQFWHWYYMAMLKNKLFKR